MKEFDELIEIFRKLRGPEGCPWDKAQNHESILQCAVDEVYEFLEAVEEKDDDHMCEELGDMLLQVVFHGQMAEERNAFTLRDVIRGINAKLHRRHPHVFGSLSADTPQQVNLNWEKIKEGEKPERKSILDGIPKALPALFYAEKIQRRAARVGFDWKEIGPVLEKVEEEFAEFKTAAQKEDKEEATEELGDILFSLVNVARHYDISAEEALRRTISKFTRRFRYVEQRVRESKQPWDRFPLSELDIFWEEAKKKELT
jgi:tetrapyrrole methylase family protein/MazG family protein